MRMALCHPLPRPRKKKHLPQHGARHHKRAAPLSWRPTPAAGALQLQRTPAWRCLWPALSVTTTTTTKHHPRLAPRWTSRTSRHHHQTYAPTILPPLLYRSLPSPPHTHTRAHGTLLPHPNPPWPQVFPYEYDLVLRPDINTRGHTQWFYFALSNTRAGARYKLNIINLLKDDSLYNDGMQASRRTGLIDEPCRCSCT